MDKLDRVLQKHPITAPAQEGLVEDTLQALMPVKRIRLARRMVVGLLLLMFILLISKWFTNDLLYLLHLLVNKFAIIKGQSTLFVDALIESFPTNQFLLMLGTSALWYCWKKFETFLLHNSIKKSKQNLAMKLIHVTPRLVIANTLVVITAIGIAGYSYAQKTEAKKLQILREHINQSGRMEFETTIPANSCDSENKQNLTNQYEIKKGTTLNSEEAKQVIVAACHQAEAKKFLVQAFHLGNPEDGIANLTESPTTEIMILDAMMIVSRTEKTITVKNPGSYHSQPQTFTLSSDVKVYKQGVLVKPNILQKNDLIVSISRVEYSDSAYGHPSGDVIARTVLGIYLLPSEPEFKWYNLDLQNSVTKIQMCDGNPQDRCTFTGSIDFFPSGGGEGNTKNPLFVQSENGEIKDITGVLTEIGDKQVKIKTSSGRIFTIEFGSDPVSEFNNKRSQYYYNDKVTLGDTLWIRYDEPADRHETTIQTEQIYNAVLMVEFIDKTKPINQY